MIAFVFTTLALIHFSTCTEVMLIQRQMEQFLKSIDSVTLTLDGEDPVLNVDLANIEKLIDRGNNIQLETNSLTTQNNALVASTNVLLESILRRLKTDELMDLLKTQHTELLDQLKSTDTLLIAQHKSVMDVINSYITTFSQAISSVKNSVDLVKDAVDLFQSVFETDDAADDTIIEGIATDVALIASNFALGMKEIIVAETAGMSLNTATCVCANFEGTFCDVVDPIFGAGPIDCFITTLEECKCEDILLTIV